MDGGEGDHHQAHRRQELRSHHQKKAESRQAAVIVKFKDVKTAKNFIKCEYCGKE